MNNSTFEIPSHICKELEYSLSLDAIDYALLTMVYILIIYLNVIALSSTLLGVQRRENLYYLLLCSNYVANLIGGSAYFGNEFIGIKRHLYSTCFQHFFGFIQVFALCNVLCVVAAMSIFHLRAVRKIYLSNRSTGPEIRKRLKIILFAVWFSNAAWTILSYACVDTLPYLSSIFRYGPFVVPHVIVVVCYVWTYILLRRRIDDQDISRQESIKSIRFAKNLVFYIFMSFIIATVMIVTANSALLAGASHTFALIKVLVWVQRSGYILFFSTEPFVFFAKDERARNYLLCCFLAQSCERNNRVGPTTNTATTEIRSIPVHDV